MGGARTVGRVSAPDGTTPQTQPDDQLTPVAELSYEEARDELVRLVSRIESGQVPLEDAMKLWERGEDLAAHCQTKLDAAQETLDRATDRGEPAVTEATTDSPAPDNSESDTPDTDIPGGTA